MTFECQSLVETIKLLANIYTYILWIGLFSKESSFEVDEFMPQLKLSSIHIWFYELYIFVQGHPDSTPSWSDGVPLQSNSNWLSQQHFCFRNRPRNSCTWKALDATLLCTLVLYRVGAGLRWVESWGERSNGPSPTPTSCSQSEPTPTSVHHEGWMINGQEIVFCWIPVA